jgi:hypothetical protein
MQSPTKVTVTIYEFPSTFVMSSLTLAGDDSDVPMHEPVAGKRPAPTIDSAGAFLYAVIPVFRL